MTVSTPLAPTGSPPLARGALRRPGGTPTWAADHPRSRGEHVSWRCLSRARPGSPPLARGAQPSERVPSSWVGITPARAGSTASGSATRTSWTDHPRSRGEHVESSTGIGRSWGSPPLARGAPTNHEDHSTRLGITPARAGSTAYVLSEKYGAPDHPRSRGEHPPGPASQAWAPGSPPLARGALQLRRPDRPPARITPARAGSTRGALRRADSRPDHPRSRGEHWSRSLPE